MSKAGIIVDSQRSSISLFRFCIIFGDDKETSQTQIGFDTLRIDLHSAIQFGKAFVAVITREINCTEENMTFDVIGILLQNFVRQLFRLSDRLRSPFARSNIDGPQLKARIEVVGIELDSLLQFNKSFLALL